MLQIHIVAGALALILGAAALLARKGGKRHRRSGQLFVLSMLTMGITASVLGPIAGGLMPAYFVVTALTTVRAVTAWTRWVNVGALVVAVVLALGSMDNGFKAFASPGATLNGIPFSMLFFIGTVMAIAAAGDVRVMRYRLMATKKTGTLQRELVEAGEAGYEFVGMTVADTFAGGSEVVAILRRRVR